MKPEHERYVVRGVLNSELAGPKRYKYGDQKVAARLDTRDASVLVSLTNDGQLTIQLSRPGLARGKLVLLGHLSVVEGGVTFTPAVPGLGFGG